MPTPRNSPERLQEAVDAVAAHGSVAAAARALGVPVETLRHRYKDGRGQGFEPENQPLAGWRAENPLPEGKTESNSPAVGQRMRGVSTLVNGQGATVMQWIKTSPDQEALEAAQRAVLVGLQAELLPISAVPRMSARVKEQLATVYTLTDCHVGMLAWNKETGADWDLEIAERVLVGTLFEMVDSSPASAVGILNQLGDFLHFDSLQPLTPTNHHVLDADSRYQKVVVVAVRVLRRVVERMLQKHETVHIEMKEGNHDPAGSVWLRVLFKQLYENEPRVTVNMSPNPYTTYQWGKTMLGFYHGHLAKLATLPILFAAQFPEMWGQTEFRYVHTGHKHHVEEKEHPGINVIQHPTLAAPDAYAARGGWLSKRQATSMTYHRERGEVARGIFIPQE